MLLTAVTTHGDVQAIWYTAVQFLPLCHVIQTMQFLVQYK